MEKGCQFTAKQLQPSCKKTIVNNVYVDDICDSVDTVAEAESLATADDKVLVAGWISNASKNDQDSQPVTLGCNEEEPDKVLGCKG